MNFEIQIGVLSDAKHYPNFVGRQFKAQGATLLFELTPKYHRIARYKFWNKFKLESSLNFKGVKPLRKNLINSLKFHLHMIYININLY
jgi:hypothetical protein